MRLRFLAAILPQSCRIQRVVVRGGKELGTLSPRDQRVILPSGPLSTYRCKQAGLLAAPAAGTMLRQPASAFSHAYGHQIVRIFCSEQHCSLVQSRKKAMRLFCRAYATVRHAPSKLRLRSKTPLSLDHFIQRQRALALWRNILRSTASIPDTATKKDMREFARAEFEQHKHVTDLGHIRYLISVSLPQSSRTPCRLATGG